MANAAPDVYGKIVYRNDRDAKMFAQFQEGKTVYEIATRWCVQYHVAYVLLDYEVVAKRLSLVVLE